MKIDRRLSEEFGSELPMPTPRWRRPNDAIELVLASAVPFTFCAALLAGGALVEYYLPSAFIWLLAISGIALFCVGALFGLVLVANAMDSPHDDMNYPGS